MLLENLLFPALLLIVFTSTSLLISRNWRISILMLALQYLGVFVLVAQSWPLEMAIVKMITGWIAGAVIGLIFVSAHSEYIPAEIWPAGQLFKLLMVLLTIITIWSLAPNLISWVPGSSIIQMTGGLILLGMGILQISLVIQPLPVVLGLLTFLSGFEILYAVVERSILIAGLLAGVNLTLALVGAYLIALPGMEEEG
ncbi:MAG: hypothetical protein ACK2UW_02000 [Anaerolineales bacterium]|jgi:hypothetical protein